MTLSEAMRLGAMLKPQGFGIWRRNEASCAMDAVVDGSGATWEMLSQQFPILKIGQLRCPVCQSWNTNVGSVIMHLNDHHRWTRERIADWIEAEFEHDKLAPAAARELDSEPAEVLETVEV